MCLFHFQSAPFTTCIADEVWNMIVILSCLICVNMSYLPEVNARCPYSKQDDLLAYSRPETPEHKSEGEGSAPWP